MNNIILTTDRLSVGYNKKPLIENINISLNKGEIVTLIGPNGAGKSTILRSIIRHLDIISGKVCIIGKELHSISSRELAKTVSVLLTEKTDPELMSCLDVVSSGRFPYTGQLGILSDNDIMQVMQAMELTAVADISDKQFNRISDGQRQRVMLARAICQQPELLVLDEPTSFLDIHHKLEMLNILKRLVREKNIGVIMSMHELDLAQRISDRVICISDNGIESCGTADEIFTEEHICGLYGIQTGSYEEKFGSSELEMTLGEPKIFVICGGGTGINIFRRLQRKGIPFAAGVLHENDLDFPTAKALAVQIITEKMFEPISETTIKKAMKIIDSCSAVYCSIDCFGTVNYGNRMLREYAESKGICIKDI